MKYRKKPVVIDAVQNIRENAAELTEFMKDCEHTLAFTLDEFGQPASVFIIKTLEGYIQASPNDFIIKGVAGEFYPCKPDIFHQTYEMVHPGITETATEFPPVML